MGKDYIKCERCGKKIFFGDVVYFREGHYAIYCSTECRANDLGETYAELNRELVEDKGCQIFNDEQIKKELQLKLEKLEVEKENIKKELKELNLQ